MDFFDMEDISFSLDAIDIPKNRCSFAVASETAYNLKNTRFGPCVLHFGSDSFLLVDRSQPLR